MRVTRSLVALGATTVLSAGLLSGCGVVATEFHPGVAATVGDQTITSDTVDTDTSDYCDALETQLDQQSQAVPRGYLRNYVVAQLASRAAVEQLARELGVQPSNAYNTQLGQLRSATADLAGPEAAAVIEVESASAYVADVLGTIGTDRLEAAGTDSPSADDAAAEGQKALGEWMADHGTEIDPKYGVELVDGKAKQAPDDVSFAAGETAKKGQAETPDPDYAASLPDAQRCG